MTALNLHAAVRKLAAIAGKVLNGGLALILLMGVAPIFILVPLAILAIDGRPIFYRGTRLGRGRKPFMIYKFRTLVRDAEKILGGELLSHCHQLTIPVVGAFLRDSRLDELPQLLNVLKGDMSWFGPRPERPEVYKSQCTGIVDYDRRFAVKPGLIGISQLFTPHGTPKRLRALIDNRTLRRNSGAMREAAFIAYTGGAILKKSSLLLGRYLYQGVLRGRKETRGLQRVRPHRARVLIDCQRDGSFVCQAGLEDINEVAFRIHSTESLSHELPLNYKLRIEVNGRGRRQRTKTATCRGRISQVRSAGGEAEFAYVIAYEPATPLSKYMIEQYFLKKSFANP